VCCLTPAAPDGHLISGVAACEPGELGIDMSRHRDFLVQLENFRGEAYISAQYVYSDMAIKYAASISKELLARLNMTPMFWRSYSGASQSAAYVCLGRVFDTKSKFNIDALIDSFESNLQLFSRQALSERKRNRQTSSPPWLQDYLAKAHYPTQKDVVRLRKKVGEYRDLYNRIIKPVRHKYIAHREKEEHQEVQALYSAGKVKELWRLVTFLQALHEALLQQYHNGRKPVLRPRRYSVKTIYDSKRQYSGPHELIIAETKTLMDFLKSAMPNNSLQGRRP
jgi:hypothetical protein